jgi:hypothetical protein
VTTTQVRLSLVETGPKHAVLRSILAADAHAAEPMLAAWLALGSCQTGRTEVVCRVVTHPMAVMPA